MPKTLHFLERSIKFLFDLREWSTYTKTIFKFVLVLAGNSIIFGAKMKKSMN